MFCYECIDKLALKYTFLNYKNKNIGQNQNTPNHVQPSTGLSYLLHLSKWKIRWGWGRAWAEAKAEIPEENF